MTGLDKILEKIIAEAKVEADSILTEARSEAADIIADAKARAEEDCAGIIAHARDDAALAEHISRSGAELEQRKALLETRQKAIAAVLADAQQRLCRLPDEQYFSVIERIAVRYADKGDGQIVFSASDKARLPAGFIDRLNAQLAKKQASLRLADDVVETGGGFVLRYGGVEENCAFSALIEQQREQLSDKLGALLFS